jgi:hypothetical protein
MKRMNELIIMLFIGVMLIAGCGKKKPIRVHITEVIDTTIGQPVQADIYVNGNLVSAGVNEATFDVPVPGEIKVEHPDYHPWSIEIDGKTECTLSGPDELRPLAADGVSG